MKQCKRFRNKKLEPGYGGSVITFTFGLMAVIMAIRLFWEGGNWVIGGVISLLISIAPLLYGMSYRLVDKNGDLK